MQQITTWRVGARFCLFAFFSALGTGLAAVGFLAALVGSFPALNATVALVQMPSAGLPEEYGWPGFALPHRGCAVAGLADHLDLGPDWG